MWHFQCLSGAVSGSLSAGESWAWKWVCDVYLFLRRIVTFLQIMINNTNNKKPPRRETKNYIIMSSIFFLLVFVPNLFFSLQKKNGFHDLSKMAGSPPVDQVAVEDHQRHPPWVFRYLKGPSRTNLATLAMGTTRKVSIPNGKSL